MQLIFGRGPVQCSTPVVHSTVPFHHSTPPNSHSHPNDSGSGYLTIPKEVLVNVSNALALYRVVINETDAGQTGSINLNLSPQDIFVVDRLRHMPSDWSFDLVLIEGEMTDFSIKIPSFEWDTFDPDSITRELVEEHYLSGSPLVSVHVRVDLSNGDEFER